MLLKVIWLILSSFIILGFNNCSLPPPVAFPQNPPAAATTPTATLTKALPWAESFGRFYTRDLARAQKEIPFTIIVPAYLPDILKDAAPPGLDGPLRGYQYDGKVEILILYLPNPSKKVRASIEIIENNHHVIPPDPKLDPRIELIKIRGTDIYKSEGNFQRGPGFIFYFKKNAINIQLGIYNFPIEEAMKVLESMLE